MKCHGRHCHCITFRSLRNMSRPRKLSQNQRRNFPVSRRWRQNSTRQTGSYCKKDSFHSWSICSYLLNAFAFDIFQTVSWFDAFLFIVSFFDSFFHMSLFNLIVWWNMVDPFTHSDNLCQYSSYSTFVLWFHGGKLHHSGFRCTDSRDSRGGWDLSQSLRCARLRMCALKFWVCNHTVCNSQVMFFLSVWMHLVFSRNCFLIGVNYNASLIYLSVKERNAVLNFS